MARLELNQVAKKVSRRFRVDDVSFTVEQGEIAVLLGPSGCGKSTTLRLVAGLDRVDGGTISIGGTTVSSPDAHIAPRDRKLGMVFQSLALWPHMKARKQLQFVLKGLGLPRSERNRRVDHYLSLVGLGDRGRSYPHQLSGGESQRLALARALVVEPSLVLLDEPLSAADRSLRERLLGEIRGLQKSLAVPMVYVTHDQEEALALADTVVIMKDGRVEQVGTARDVYERPASRFVASFVGRNNVVQGVRMADGRFETSLGPVALPASANGQSSVWLSLRPEELNVSSTGVPCEVESATYQGGRWLLTVSREQQRFHVFHREFSETGSQVSVAIDGEGWVLEGGEESQESTP